ncbi:MAG: RNA polymerase sigma factor [Gemmataceae bacterium]
MSSLLKTPVSPPARASSDSGWRADPDVTLMLRVQQDDAEAFAELIARFRGRIYAHLLRRLGNRQDAEDLTQEVFLRLFRHRKRYQPRARLGTWLFHITHNLTCNALRSRQHQIRGSINTVASGALPEPHRTAKENSPSQRLENTEVATIVRAAVKGLAFRQRAAIELHQFRDCSYAEVAAELEMTPKAAKSLLYRARGQLRSLLSSFMTTTS